ncbi:hypothetical protein HYY74_03425 [Candidatus Woesearchaeota archaeon]|nr:hypothetical protein [Candidatus Woesearchaeota archaeon]
MKTAALLAIMLILAATAANAQSGHMKILAVTDKVEGGKGMIADLYLEVKPGQGKVFIESFPLTKMDTQISTRFAKEIACSELDLECDQYDFFYTIKADTALVGGPSAGAAAAVLTAAVVEGAATDESTAITGTINSGGLVGPVGGLQEKITASPERGVKKVLIAKGQRYVKSGNASNATIDLVAVGKENGVQVIEVVDMREALYHFTGRQYIEEDAQLSIDESYAETMQKVAESLCNKSTQLMAGSNDTSANNLTERGMLAIKIGQYYSAASYCFGANIRYKVLENANLTQEQVRTRAGKVVEDSTLLENGLTRPKTVADVQSYATVKERLLDATDTANLTLQRLQENKTRDAIALLAYAEERVYSAQAWAQFIGKDGQRFEPELIEKSCRSKLSEAEERYEYVKLFFPETLAGTRRDIDRAYDDLNAKRFELCLSKAAKAKAESDVILNTLGVEDSQVSELVEKKLEIAKRTIVRNSKKGIFPILGYSYYEYANSLKDTDKYSALLYSEYALELSNMDVYFRKDKAEEATPAEQKMAIVSPSILIFSAGLMTGAVIVFILGKYTPKRNGKLVKKAALRRR